MAKKKHIGTLGGIQKDMITIYRNSPRTNNIDFLLKTIKDTSKEL